MSFLNEKSDANIAFHEANIFQFRGDKIPVGHRNHYLTGKGRCHALRSARHREGDYDLILDDLDHINRNYFAEPIPEKQLAITAGWASSVQLSGKNWFGLPISTERKSIQLPLKTTLILPRSRIGHLSLTLLCEICRYHPAHHVFFITDRFINRAIGRKNPPKGDAVNRRDHAAIKAALIASGLIVQLSEHKPHNKHALFGFGTVYFEAMAE